MKKILALLIILVFITGCGTKNEKVLKSCKITTNNVALGYTIKSEYNIHGTNNIVDNIIITETIISDDASMLEKFEREFSENYKSANELYGGYENTIDKYDDSIISNTTIDCHKMDAKKYVKDYVDFKELVDSKGNLLVDKLVSNYEKMGATCE